MIDREKRRQRAIRVLENERECCNRTCIREECRSCDLTMDADWLKEALEDAIFLLKEMEPTYPVLCEGRRFWEYSWHCARCNCELYHSHKLDGESEAKKIILHCRRCGRKVNWDGAKGNGL